MKDNIIESDLITSIRGFNRFYTNILGLLNKGVLHSDYSLTEARVLYEIGKQDHCKAKSLSSLLEIDKSYLSRILNRFEASGLIQREPSSRDNRSSNIRMTEQGHQLLNQLEEESYRQIEKMIEPLEDDAKNQIVESMAVIRKYLTIATADLALRKFESEDIDYIIARQLSLYKTERGFDSDTWNRYLIDGVRSFTDNFNAEKESIFILEYQGEHAGCIAVKDDGSHVAQLRYFFLEPEVRGLGAGKKLLDHALDYCREKDYHHVFCGQLARKRQPAISMKSTDLSLQRPGLPMNGEQKFWKNGGILIYKRKHLIS